MTEIIHEGSDTKELVVKQPQKITKAYRRRWFILAIYIMYAAANSFQCMEYAVIANIVAKYYNVSLEAVNWTCIIYMVIYPFIMVPASYLIKKKGLRVAALLSGIATALAAFVKVFSIRQDLYSVVFIGQVIGSIAHVLILSLPGKIAAVWFKPNEVSTACAIGIFGIQLGLTSGFQIPPAIVKNDIDEAVIGSRLMKLCWILTIYMIPVVTVLIFFFPRLPPLPPSEVQAEERKKYPPTFRQFISAFKKFFRSIIFLKHLIGYGIIIGVLSGISTFFNRFVLDYFPNSEAHAARMGFLMRVLGMTFSIIVGAYLDKTHRYKETAVFIYCASTLCVVGLMLSLYFQQMCFTYITAAMFGLFTYSYMAVGFEFAIELTFPSDENTAIGILNVMSQSFGVFIILGMGKLFRHCGSLSCLLSTSILLLVGAILTQTIPDENKRQTVFMEHNRKTVAIDENV